MIRRIWIVTEWELVRFCRPPCLLPATLAARAPRLQPAIRRRRRSRHSSG